MEPPSKSPEAAPETPKRRWRSGIWISAFGIFLLALIIVCVFLASSNRDLVWLTPADLTPVNHSGPLIQLKYKIKSFIMPVWKHFQHKPSVVELDATFLSVTEDAVKQFSLGDPLSTSPNGMRAWILSPAQLDTFNHGPKTNPGVLPIRATRIITMEGIQSRVRVQAVNLITGGMHADDSASAIADIVPKIISDSIKIMVGASATNLAGRTPDQLLIIRTNFAFACQVIIPNAGALVVNGGNVKDLNGTNYWLIISPTILDAQGKPLKP